MKGRRSASTLTLVLIGAAAMSGCGGSDKNEQATRDVYRSRADCQRDWGDDAKKCEQITIGVEQALAQRSPDASRPSDESRYSGSESSADASDASAPGAEDDDDAAEQ